MTSPAGDVTAIAAAKLRQGAGRLHGLTSFPLVDTNVRGANAKALTAKKLAKTNRDLRISHLLKSILESGAAYHAYVANPENLTFHSASAASIATRPGSLGASLLG